MNDVLLHKILTSSELTPATKVVGSYLVVAKEPQNGNALAETLGFTTKTVSRSLASLKQHGHARKVNGVWLPSEPETRLDLALGQPSVAGFLAEIVRERPE